MPSALTNDINTPAPLANGVATTRSPTLPNETRINSSSPMGESTLRVSTACIVGRSGGSCPCQRYSSGRTIRSNVIAADTG